MEWKCFFKSTRHREIPNGATDEFLIYQSIDSINSKLSYFDLSSFAI